LARSLKWLIPLILLGCQLEPEIVYVPEIYEIRDTLYVQVHDTSYVTREASFGLSTEANLYITAIDTISLVYWYALTKLDSTPVDSVFLTGYLFEWNTFRTSANMMDSTQVVVWPDNAGSWNYPYDYSMGEFDASNKWNVDDWPNGYVTYTMELEYK